MSQENLKNLKEMIKALYPVIYIVSYEEKRILNIIDNLLKEKGFGQKLKTWSNDAGLVNSEGAKEGGDDLMDPVQMLEKIKNTPENEKTVYVLKDFDAFLPDDLVQRHLRTIVEDGLIHVNIIILSPLLTLPQRLSKSIQVIEWSLPTESERDTIINYVKNAKKVLTGEARDKVNKAMAGLTEMEAVNVIARQAAINKDEIVSIGLLNKEKLSIVKKNPVLEIYQPKFDDTFDNLGGWDLAKLFIEKRKTCFSEDSRAFGVEAPKGLLLFGVPGCGKSKFAKCIGYEYNLPVVILSLASVMAQSGGIVGQAENWLQEAFRTIEAVAPCVVFMDEIEKGASGMESSGATDGGMTSRTLSVFLDKLENRNADFFVVATANNVNSLSPEMVRPGRWDRIMFSGLPNTEEREVIFRIHLLKRKAKIEKIDFGKLASITDAYNGAEIEQIVKDGYIEAYVGKRELNTNLLMTVCKEMTPQSKSQGEKIQALIKWATDNGAKFVSSSKADGDVQVLQLIETKSDEKKQEKN
jgi:ATP-dependent 26S proteasome regulatory subunit